MATRKLYGCTLRGKVKHEIPRCQASYVPCYLVRNAWFHVINPDCPCLECRRGDKLRVCRNCWSPDA